MTKIRIFRITAAVATLGMTVVLSGCGEPPAPEPPEARSRITLEMLKQLRAGNHKQTVVLLEKMKPLYKDNLFIEKLQNLEIDNITLEQVQRKLDGNDIAGACKILDGAVKKHPFHRALTDASKNLKELLELQRSVAVLCKPESAEAVKSAAVTIQRIAKSNKNAAGFAKVAEEYRELAAQMAVAEDINARLDLLCDAAEADRAGDEDVAAVLKALLRIENEGRKNTVNPGLLNKK